MNNALINAFNLAPMKEEKPSTEVTVIDNAPQAEADVELARENVLKLIETLGESVKELAILADQSQSDRMYQSLSHLAKTYLDANESIINMHIEKQKIQELTNAKKDGDTHNHLYITTEEMLKIIQKNQNR